MKRLHLHIAVADLDQAIPYYRALFDAEPVKIKQDYAKWELEDPRVNLSISTRSNQLGLDHLGIQCSSETELTTLRENLQAADIAASSTSATTCCYAESVKSWSVDPAGIPWESFVTMKDAELYGTDNQSPGVSNACCGVDLPQTKTRAQSSSCC